jgi:AraC-like DNA-binding protein
MTGQGKSITLNGENNPAIDNQARFPVLSCPCFHRRDKNCSIETKDLYSENRVSDNFEDCYELFSSDIHFWYGKTIQNIPVAMLIDNKESFLQMSFSIKCNSAYRLGKDKKYLLNIGQHQHNLLLIPAQEIHLDWQKEGQFEAVVINFSPEFFFRYLPESLPLFAIFKKSYEKKVPAILSSQNLMINSKIMSILYEILHCQHKGCYKRLFVESKVMELLTIQLEQSEHLNDNPSHHQALKKDELEKMHLVREIVLANLENPPSLTDLARQVGTNEFNLKKHFKQVFGTTVFGFIHTYRMEQAKEMLKKEDIKISEIAKAAGYKHSTHFTTAFKKYFGFLPNKIRS